MHVERLRHLVTVLERVQNEAKPFDMDTWIDTVRTGDLSCGTSACAIGYAAQDPVFQQAGLSLVVNYVTAVDEPPGVQLICNRPSDYRMVEESLYIRKSMPTFEGLVLFDAVAHLFEISHKDAHWLFDIRHYGSYSYVTPDHVIGRVKAMLVREAAPVMLREEAFA